MLSVSNKHMMLNVLMQLVIVLNVVAPLMAFLIEGRLQPCP
jgi:hypothetical protein